MRQKCRQRRCVLKNRVKKEKKSESWVNVDEEISFKVNNKAEKASDKIVDILADLEAIEVPEENADDANSKSNLDELAENLPEIQLKTSVVEIPDEIDADNESLAMLDWIEAEKAGKMEEKGEKIVASNYVKGILGNGKGTKLKGILKKTSKSEAKITETMLRYILYGEKNATFEMDEVNDFKEDEKKIVEDVDEIMCTFKEYKNNHVEDEFCEDELVNNSKEDKNNLVEDEFCKDELIKNLEEDKNNIVEDVDEDDDEEELRRSLEAEELEDISLVSNTFGQCFDEIVML